MDLASVEQVDGHWLLLSYEDSKPIRLDARFLDRVLACGAAVELQLGAFVLSLPILGGPYKARHIAELLSVFTRSAPITTAEAYADSKRRLELAARGRSDNGSLWLFIGDRDVFVTEDEVFFGDTRVCSVTELQVRADEGRGIQCDGYAIRAGLACLVVAAAQRHEDVARLAEKVSEYERRYLAPRSESEKEPQRE